MGWTWTNSCCNCEFINYNATGKLKFSVSKAVAWILMNSIEVSVSLRNIDRNLVGFKVIFAFWLLMSVTLTNSYRGLIISYLSLPWEPEPDYNYFDQILEFQFYSPIPSLDEERYFSSCNRKHLFREFWEASPERMFLISPTILLSTLLRV